MNHSRAAQAAFGKALLKIKAVYGRPGVGASGELGVMQAPGSGVFYDLGSGAGKPAVAAVSYTHLTLPTKRIV